MVVNVYQLSPPILYLNILIKYFELLNPNLSPQINGLFFFLKNSLSQIIIIIINLKIR